MPQARADDSHPHDDARGRSRSQSQSPARRARRSHHRRRPHNKSRRAAAASLPFSARALTKSDFRAFEPLFAHYLELQKQRDLGDMDEREARGRWKSFAGKWNRNELAEGWYDPDMFARCASEYCARPERRGDPGDSGDSGEGVDGEEDEDEDEDEDDFYGPTLPGVGSEDGPRVRRMGARSATAADLSLRDELAREQREDEREQLRHARREDRALQKRRLEELVPRAEPGTRERRLEKKKEVNEKMGQFRERSPGVEVGEAQLMGAGDELEEHRRMREREKVKKSQRQVRREEFERAKAEDMEVKRRVWREREEGTVSMLKELAKQRFG
ncbi:hypothetical protein C2857_006123 [Epichloe festucae Fl1]|uniref:RNA helicase HEL117 n=2 Tax=Epichloe festucae TaxID=35717 RepID=A0A7S9KLE4_EPIFF|nr:hypothetical protein 17A8-11 [Epichloe festucae]QPG94464.1 hypothetical protein C2857_006123 [Epichloe festucae Fl1]